TREVWKNWEELKKKEKAEKPATKKLLDAPLHLPALQRAAKIGHRTSKLKFDWENAEQVLEKVREEFEELDEAIEEKSTQALIHEMGDVLFSLAQLSRHLGIDPEQCLREGNRRFENRFGTMMSVVKEENLSWERLGNDEKERLWAEAKQRTAKDE
ncbi:MAG TPA: MazG nucleotide pyrophosphohydrolase domain-containing protein, partial [Pseudobdellovibrionaceae bacterium]|nr:MazG nucleotide pyrophosphohydrolase domain-containing protein [Pseudobdellovibrionaceae bacterium]